MGIASRGRLRWLVFIAYMAVCERGLPYRWVLRRMNERGGGGGVVKGGYIQRKVCVLGEGYTGPGAYNYI